MNKMNFSLVISPLLTFLPFSFLKRRLGSVEYILGTMMDAFWGNLGGVDRRVVCLFPALNGLALLSLQ